MGRALPVTLLFAAAACGPQYDVIIRHGTVYDGSGGPGMAADVAISGDTIAAIGDLTGARAALEVDATGLAVAPGFINMLSWATESLLVDGRSQADIRQGVTLEVFGEGWSMGPLHDAMKKEALEQQGDLKFDIPWTTLDGYLEHLEKKGVAPNVASFVGATTVRIHEVGFDDREPTAGELDRMRRRRPTLRPPPTPTPMVRSSRWRLAAAILITRVARARKSETLSTALRAGSKVSGHTWKAFRKREKRPFAQSKEAEGERANHWANFLEAIRLRAKRRHAFRHPRRSPLDIALPSRQHLLPRRPLAEVIGAQEKFANDPEADSMLTRVYRKPYVVPEAV